MMFPVKPLTEHPDADGGHIAGSQQAADATIARNMQRAAHQQRGINSRRLAHAGSVQRVSFTGRRRVGLRAVVMFLLCGLVLLGAIVLIALGGAGLRNAHAQTIGEPVCYISAPPVLPQSNPLNCLQPRVFIPIM